MIRALTFTLAAALFTTGLLVNLVAAPPAAPAHAHPEKGPNGGPLLELGDEEFHAEVLLDEKAGTFGICLLDSAAKAAVPIEGKELVINLKHGGKPVQYKLPAAPLKTDPQGQSSRFALKSKELVHDLHHKDHGARLAVKIRGKSYSAKVELAHNHDHKH